MYDIIIIGSGPAGLTAAIYTSRDGLKTLVIAGTSWGGQLMLTTEIENFPGFSEGVMGPELMEKMRKQAEKFGAEIILEDAASVDFKDKPFKVKAGGKTYEAHSVIIATGASRRWLGLESERRLRGRGVSVCATCDGPFFRDRRVVVVGGGDAAIEEALELTKFAKEVKIIHRRSQLRASRILQKRAFSNPKIGFIWNAIVQEIIGKERVKGVKLERTDTGGEFTIKCDGVFVAIGSKPNTEIFRNQIELDKDGYIITHDETKTSVEGVFAAGDMQDRRYRQAVIAAASGCKAALDAEKYLEKEGS
ncbi:TPA: thioredoxin-disulfide reductase [Candidatus Bathyarchaeota archaeon]|nr:thioredoxin-disulfide reductase [Candidatus Bathyarchaeota archaeon]